MHRASLWRCIATTAIVALGGCQAPSAPFDPFLSGRSTIPPPGTAVPAATAPYYSGAPPAVVVPAPGAVYTAPGAVPITVPAATVPPTGGGQLPRGISVPQSNNQTNRDGAQLAWQPSDAQQPPQPSSPVVRASYEETGREPIRIVDPAARQAPSGAERESNATATPAVNRMSDMSAQSKPQPTRLPELTDLPLVRDSAVREVPGYGYDPRYAWLKGKLEYSPSQQRWKLRYISVERPTDDFGGSVVLPASDKLKGFEAGDLVVVEGRLLQTAENATGFSPPYHVDRIKKQ